MAFVLFAVGGCARPVAPAPVPASSAEPIARPAAPTAEGAPRPRITATEAPDDERIERDLRLAVGGNFAPDHIGPDVFAAVVRRMQAAPAAYAHKLGELYGRSPPPPELPRLHTTAVLVRLYAGAPDETSQTAHALLLSLGQLMPALDRESDARKQALAQMPMLEALAGGIDLPFDAAAPAMAIDRVCAVPTPGGHGLMVMSECTCGERPVCRAALDRDRVDVRVRRDDARAPNCDDCFASWSTCSLPPLRAAQRVSVVLDGRSFGELTAGKSGTLVPGVCLSRSP